MKRLKVMTTLIRAKKRPSMKHWGGFIRLSMVSLFLVGILSVAVLWLWLDQPRKDVDGQEFNWNLPQGFPSPEVPLENPMSPAKVELGRRLFYDKQLSGNGLQSCATCHQQGLAFTDGQAQPFGSTGQRVRRNSMSLINVAYATHFTWAHNGLQSLERQILIPLFNENPVEMGLTGSQERLIEALAADPEYNDFFSRAFSAANPVTMDNVVKALASFVRSLVSFQSPFDRYAYAGDDSALSPLALEGLGLFMSERLECRHCHSGFNFSETSQHASQKGEMVAFHVTGLYYPREDIDQFEVVGSGSHIGSPLLDRGLYDVTFQDSHKDRFKAPSLRNVAVTAPYMHDGSLATLEEVIEFYARGGREAPSEYFYDGGLHPSKSLFVRGFELSEHERLALKTFLESLTDPTIFANPNWSNPKLRPDS